MNRELIIPVTELHAGYLRDESCREGTADTISFPASEREAEEVVRLLWAGGADHQTAGALQTGGTDHQAAEPHITCRGGGTGIRGLAVPHGGHLMSLSGMNRIRALEPCPDGTACAVVEPGVTLGELRTAVRRTFREPAYFWPPSPTEQSATIGGIAATGACGMNVCCYGDTAAYIRSMSVILPQGTKRIYRADAAEPENRPSAWLSAAPQHGVITELTLRLVRRPEEVWGIACFFPEEDGALRCADALQTVQVSRADACVTAMEYFDATALRMIAADRERIDAIRSVPDYPDGTEAMIYLEAAGAESAVEQVILELVECAAEFGSDPDLTWAFCGEAETEKMHAFRHAAAETAAERTAQLHGSDARISRLVAAPRLGTRSFRQSWLAFSRELKEAGFPYTMYAHIRPSMPELTIFPEAFDAYRRGQELIDHWKKGMSAQKGATDHDRL